MQDTDLLQTTLVALVVFGWGAAWAYLQERFGFWDTLPATWKQIFNGLTTALLPFVTTWLGPNWRPEFGDLTAVFPASLRLIAPLVVAGFSWLASQVAHERDGLAKRKRAI